ncbi:MAG: MOSC domain-containing protein [Actinomycetota bacterium]
MNARVSQLWRYPVKSMLGEQVPETEIGKHGVVGDRSFALIDVETGKICSAKRYDLWGRLFEFRATLERPGVATITFPDGSTMSTDEPSISDRISGVLGRPVRLSATVPAGAKLEEVWDPSKGEQMYGPPTGDELEGQTIIDVEASFASPGDFFDFSAIHFITTNTVDHFNEIEPETTFDVRRFRPNLVIDVDGEGGFVENDWKGLRIGDVEIRTLMPVPRCVMTTLPQENLPKESNVLRAAAKHNMLDTVAGRLPCAGIYAMVATEGTVRVGDSVDVQTQ